MKTPLTPLEFMRRSRRLHPQQIAVVDGDERWTFAQLFARCDRASAALARLGVGRGDRVVYIAPNTHAQLESFYAVPQLGAVLVPLNYRLTASDFAYMIEHSGAEVVCAHADYLEAVDSIRGQIPGVRHFIALEGTRAGWLQYEALLDAEEVEAGRTETARSVEPIDINEDDPITINYTSGTTSRPKGVVITHRNAWLNCIGTLVHVHMSSADRYLWTLPMFHANGWTFVWTVTAVGGCHVCLRKVDPRLVFERIAAERITILCAAPAVLIGIANSKEELRRGAPRGLRVLTAGAPPAAATIERVEKDLGWTITHVYGLTETSPFITVSEERPAHATLDPTARARQKARQGVELITSGELLVVGEDGREVPWDGATLGEIVVRGNAVMKGYYNDPEATARAFAGGYFHSGDAAVVHEDGYLEIRDRFKDVIISGGENISSVEVEGALLRHPAVLEAAVVGLPDEKWGEAPHAFVILRDGLATTSEEIRSFLREHLAHFKVPKRVHFVAELPRTATGKVQKYLLRAGRAAIATQ